MTQEQNEFGTRLKQIREEHGLTQTDLAAECEKFGPKIPPQAISEYESGKHKPSRDKVLQITKALGLQPFDMNSLLLAAGYAPDLGSRADKARNSPAAQLLLSILSDETMLEKLLTPPGEDVISQLLEAWQDYGKAKAKQYGRDWDATVALCDQAMAKLDVATDQLRGYLLDTIGNAEGHRGNLPKATLIFQNLSNLTSKLNDPYLKGQIYIHQGELYRLRSDWHGADAKFQAATHEFLGINDTKLARTYRKEGLLYLAQGNWQLALERLNWSKGIFEKTGILERADRQYELAKVYMALGWVYSLNGDWDKAISFRRQGLERSQKHRVLGQTPDDYLVMQGHLYYGGDLRMTGEFAEAKKELDLAHELSRSTKEKKEKGMVLYSLARLHLDLYRQDRNESDWQTAENNFNRAYEEHSRLGDRLRLARTQMHRAELYLRPLKSNQVNTAIQYLEEASGIFKTLDHHYYLAEASIRLAEAYRQFPSNPVTIGGMLEDGVREVKLSGMPYYHQLARLNELKARLLYEQGQFDVSISLFAEALLDAVKFNHYISRSLRKHIYNDLSALNLLQPSEQARERRSQLLERFQSNYDSGRGFEYRDEQKKDADAVISWLEKLVTNPTSTSP